MTDGESVFSNRATGAAERAEQYIEAVLGLVGDRDPFEVLSSTVSWCTECTAGLPRKQLDIPESPGKWSIVAVLQHLADAELVWGSRLRKVLAEDRPALGGFDQDLWAERMDYAGANREQALDLFRSLRAANLRLLEGASDEDLNRKGVHAERGEETLFHMIRLYAGHDLVHRRQLRRIVDSKGPN